MSASPTAQRLTVRPIKLPTLREHPLVSVLLINFNYEQYLAQAIESVLQQTYDRLELIICDDGSTDGSVAIERWYAAHDERVRAHRQENQGQAAATNAAYFLSSGDVLCLLDADDVFERDKLARVVTHFASRPQAGLLVHPMMVVDRCGRPIQRGPFWDRFEEGDISSRIVTRGGHWRKSPSSAISVRREAAAFAFPIPETRDQDAFLYTLLPLLTEVAVLPEILSSYRLHGKNLSGADAITESRMVETIKGERRTVEIVNQRLAELGATCHIDYSRNVNGYQSELTLALLQGRPRRDIVGLFRTWTRHLQEDDYFSFAQKLLSALVYAIAIALPRVQRRALLQFVYTPNRHKQHLLMLAAKMIPLRGRLPLQYPRAMVRDRG